MLAAAVALVVHLFVAGTANAALAGSGELVLCSGIGNRAIPDPDHPRDHSRLTDCCLPGCSMLGGAAAVPRLPAVHPPAGEGSDLGRPRARVARVESHELSPINPRGPPLPA